MNSVVIDSSGWLEYFSGGKKSKTFAEVLHGKQTILTPTLILYEVYKKIAKEKTESDALLVVTQIEGRSEKLIPLDDELAIFAADISLQHKLALADAIIYASALQEAATLMTRDHHFKDLEQVVLIE